MTAVRAPKFDDVKACIEQANEARWAGIVLFQALLLSKNGRFPTLTKIAHIHAK